MAKAPASIGHNGGPIMGDVKDALKGYFTRLESLADEAAAIRDAVKTVSADMKEAGFNPSAAKKLVALRAKDKEKVLAAKETLELYAHALGIEDLV